MTINKIIGIVSCKGGVGKTTASINLSAALNFYYKKNTGLLDADIYGPNHPSMLGLSNYNLNINNKKIEPKKTFGFYSMSFGYFLNKNSSVLLRGPMISNTINYLFNKTAWGNLDHLIIDFPPGTGDIYLSLLRDIKINGVFLITTSQLPSLEDIRRSINMIKKFNIKIYGILENMTHYSCNNCKAINYINKNNNNLKEIITDFNIKNIYKLPFDNTIVESINLQKPCVIYKPEAKASIIFKDMAKTIT